MIGIGRDGPLGPSSAGASAAAPGRQGATVGTPTLAERGPRRRPGPGPDREHTAWAVLASVEGLGPVGLMQLVNACGGAAAVLAAASRPGAEPVIAEALEGRGGVGLAARVVDAARGRGAILESLRASGVAVVTLDDGDYPDRLRAIELPPPVLFIRGHAEALAAGRSVAVVGTRRPTDAGRSVAARLAGTLARAGAVVVSGLAVGIDGVAHAATLGVGGRTVAVLGGGHDVAITRRHRSLAEQIAATGGAVVSEHAPGTAPSRGTFPRRNRVISGLAEATVIVEAGARSGALITAGWALEQGRECFVVPGPIDAPMSAGCLGLLRAYPGQVRVVAGVAALVEDIGLDAPSEAGRVPDGGRAGVPAARRGAGGPAATTPSAGPRAVLATLPAPVEAVARALVGGARTVDHVVMATALPVPGALAALTMLEDLGLVVAAYGRYRLAGGLSDLG